MCDEVKEEQLYVVLKGKYGKSSIGKIVRLENGFTDYWYGPWYWGFYNVVETGERIHNKVLLKKHTPNNNN